MLATRTEPTSLAILSTLNITLWGSLSDFGFDGCLVGIVRDVDKWSFVGHQPAFGRKIGQIAQAFHRFERDNQAALTFGDKVRGAWVDR